MPRTSRTGLAATALLALSLSMSFVLTSDDARACGGFFARGPDVPALEVEETLILHDPVRGVEHFIREIAFRKANATFGFVVPTPARPEVAKVDDAPFQRLRDRFPMSAPRVGPSGLGGLAGIGATGSGAGAVEILSKQRLGSFTAFVLAATDAGAMAKWLADNHFETTPASQSWLAHYVARRFFFVAFRFEPPDAKSATTDGGAPAAGRSTNAETMRISFSTPVPYYPYLEPEHAAQSGPRVLSVWLMTPNEMTPVAAANDGGHVQWKRPWLEGYGSHASVESLKETLGRSLSSLLPSASKPAPGEREDEPSLSVQVFEDQKKSRRGWGDVVLVPNAPVALDEAALAKRRPFFALLDPEAAR